MMGNAWNYGWGAGNFLGGFGMFIFWIVIVGLIVWAVMAATRSGRAHEHNQSPSPQDIARVRYARGEITKEQYDQLRKDLT